jgi:hypothetical protein
VIKGLVLDRHDAGADLISRVFKDAETTDFFTTLARRVVYQTRRLRDGTESRGGRLMTAVEIIAVSRPRQTLNAPPEHDPARRRPRTSTRTSVGAVSTVTNPVSEALTRVTVSGPPDRPSTRHVSPNGEARPDGAQVLARQ